MTEIDLLRQQLAQANDQITRLQQENLTLNERADFGITLKHLQTWLDDRKSGYAKATLDNAFGGFSVKLERNDRQVAYYTDHPLTPTLKIALLQAANNKETI